MAYKTSLEYTKTKQELQSLGVPDFSRKGGPCGPIALSLALDIPIEAAVKISMNFGYIPGKSGTYTHEMFKTFGELESIPYAVWMPACGIQHFHAIGRKIAKNVGMGTFLVYSSSYRHIACVKDGKLLDWTLHSKSTKNVVSIHRVKNPEDAKEKALKYLGWLEASSPKWPFVNEKPRLPKPPKPVDPNMLSKKTAKVGMEVEFEHRQHIFHGTIARTQGSKRARIDLKDGGRPLMVPYGMLKKISDAPQSYVVKQVKRNVNVGDEVMFGRPGGRKRHGRVIKLNKVTAKVNVKGVKWSVGYGFIKVLAA